MKKLLSAIIIIFIILLMLWAVVGWYFGSKTEQEFKGFLEESSQLAGKRLFRAELVSYKRTASGARASLDISSDYPLLNERLGELKLNVKLLNGPVFITHSGVSAGSSRWVLQVVDGSDAVKEYEELFPNSLPSAVVRVDFEEKAHYVAKLETSFARSLITGIFDLETQDNRGAIALKDFVLGERPNVISANNIQISYQHHKAITTRYKPGTASLQIKSLRIQYKQLLKSLVLDVKVNSNISLNENALSGFIKSDVRNVNTAASDDFPIETAELSLFFKGLPADAFIAYSEANDDLDNLHQQAQWALEELGEVPEGQDQIWSLYDRIEESSNRLPKILAEQMHGDNKPLVQIKAVTHYQKSSSHLEGNINLNSENPKISSWLSLLEGEAQVELDDALFEMVQTLLPITKPKFQLLLKDNKVLMIK
jgi:hypothetical protein